jgi:hypothetical protein
LKVFLPLYKWLRRKGIQREDIFFGISGSKEYKLVTENYLFFYDFTIKNLKIIIEFHGVGFHARSPSDILIREKAEDVIARDKRKELVAIENGFEIFTIWSDENNLLDICKYFILKKLEKKDEKL